MTNVENRAGKVFLGTTLLYAFSLHKYNRGFFRIDGNSKNAAIFALCSLPVSYAYAKFFLDDANNEAALRNNAKEGF